MIVSIGFYEAKGGIWTVKKETVKPVLVQQWQLYNEKPVKAQIHLVINIQQHLSTCLKICFGKLLLHFNHLLIQIIYWVLRLWRLSNQNLPFFFQFFLLDLESMISWDWRFSISRERKSASSSSLRSSETQAVTALDHDRFRLCARISVFVCVWLPAHRHWRSLVFGPLGVWHGCWKLAVSPQSWQRTAQRSKDTWFSIFNIHPKMSLVSWISDSQIGFSCLQPIKVRSWSLSILFSMCRWLILL